MKRSKKRHSVPKKTSKKLFQRTAKGVHPRNLARPHGVSRGGERL